MNTLHHPFHKTPSRIALTGTSRHLQFIAIVILLGLAFLPQLSSAQAPRTMSYQGFLTDADGLAVADGSYNVRFALYDAVNSGTPSWEETLGVSVENGLFNVLLGTQTDLELSFDKQYWLGIRVDSDPEMLPRTPLSATPYSLHAVSVANDAVTTSSIADSAVEPVKIQPGQNGDVLQTVGGTVVWAEAVAGPSVSAFRHVSTVENISASASIIDHPQSNFKPNANLHVTHIDGDVNKVISAPLGVFYSNSSNKWAIFVEDLSAFPANREFSVIVVN